MKTTAFRQQSLRHTIFQLLSGGVRYLTDDTEALEEGPRSSWALGHDGVLTLQRPLHRRQSPRRCFPSRAGDRHSPTAHDARQVQRALFVKKSRNIVIRSADRFTTCWSSLEAVSLVQTPLPLI